MSVRITSQEKMVALFDSGPDVAFGPVFDSEAEAEQFLEWAEHEDKGDLRHADDVELAEWVNEFRHPEITAEKAHRLEVARDADLDPDEWRDEQGHVHSYRGEALVETLRESPHLIHGKLPTFDHLPVSDEALQKISTAIDELHGTTEESSSGTPTLSPHRPVDWVDSE